MKDCFHVMQKALAKWTMDWNLGSKRTQRLPVGCGRSVRRRSGFVGAACQIGRCHRQRQLRAWHPKLNTGRGGSVAWPGAGACFAPTWPAQAGPGTAEWQNGRTPRGGRPGGRQARGAVRRAHKATGHCPAAPATREAPEPNQRVRGCEQPPSAPRLATFRPLVPPSARSDGAFKSTEIHPIPRLVTLNEDLCCNKILLGQT
jgi:hypothetical protein